MTVSVTTGRLDPYALVTGDFVKTGGMDRANHALAAYLLGRGHEVHLVGFRAGADLLDHPNASLHRVAKPLNSYLLSLGLLDRAGRRWGARIAARGGRVVVNGGNCRWGDVNWLHHLNVLDRPLSGGGPLRRAHRRLGYRLFVHGDHAALRVARLIVTTCERNKADLIDWLGTPAERVRTVYYGIDAALFRPAGADEKAALRQKFGWPTGRPVVAFVGALGDRRKGFDTLFAAWSGLCRGSSWDAHLVVVGAGAELPAWRQRASDAGVGDRVEFLGFRRDVPDVLRASDAHVLPSRYEGYSLVTQEALCCGLPAFVTDTAGIAERYPDDLRDLLIPDPDDATDLADRLRRWRDDRSAVAARVERLSEVLRAHTWRDMAAQFVDVVEGAAL